MLKIKFYFFGDKFDKKLWEGRRFSGTRLLKQFSNKLKAVKATIRLKTLQEVVDCFVLVLVCRVLTVEVKLNILYLVCTVFTPLSRCT